MFNNSEAPTNDPSAKSLNCTLASCAKKNLMARLNAKHQNENSSYHKMESCISHLSNNAIVFKDITNLTNNTNQRQHLEWPNDSELMGSIIQVNNMLSNFVVSYFFKIFASKFGNILFTEFLFDFVKRDGGWKSFVQSSLKEGHYINFLNQLSHHKSRCLRKYSLLI